jgi:hypothetical protein
MERGKVDGTIREWKHYRWPFFLVAVVSMAVLGSSGIMIGSVVIDGVLGAVVGGTLGIVGVYSSRILFSISREMIAPYAKPRRSRRSP